MYNSIPTKPRVQFWPRSTLLIQQGCSTIASGIYLWSHVTTTLNYPFYPFEFVPYTSQVHSLFSIHPFRCHKPLKHPVDNIKINWWQQLELASELESDLRDTVNWSKKWKWMGLFLRKIHLLRCWIISIAKTAFKKIGALIPSMKFLSLEVALYLL